MKVLIACEMSGVVRRAFRAAGHAAWSCDLLPAMDDSAFHLQEDVLGILDSGWNWDMMVAFPPCTHLAISGARWFERKRESGEQQAAIEFFLKLANADIPMIAIENPVGIMSTHFRKPDQVIHPYMFGHPVRKKTCLWLKGGLPKLRPTNVVEPDIVKLADGSSFSAWEYKISGMKKTGPTRGLLRSITFQGIADAMAQQWGSVYGPYEQYMIRIRNRKGWVPC